MDDISVLIKLCMGGHVCWFDGPRVSRSQMRTFIVLIKSMQTKRECFKYRSSVSSCLGLVGAFYMTLCVFFVKHHETPLDWKPLKHSSVFDGWIEIISMITCPCFMLELKQEKLEVLDIVHASSHYYCLGVPSRDLDLQAMCHGTYVYKATTDLMSHSQFHSTKEFILTHAWLKEFILTHAWLNL